MKTKFKVCIIGCGVISDNHLLPLSSLNTVSITALCDIVKEKAEIKRDKYKLNCSIYSDYLKMLDCEKPDAVHILTPHYLHTEMTLEALKRNVNVLLEKPLCIKEEDIEKIINAEKESEAKVTVSFQTRYNETVKIAERIVKEDGGVKSAYATIVWNRNDDYYASGDWRGKWRTEGGGVLINQAIHTLDLLCNFIGIPKNIQATCAKFRHSSSIEVEDTCQCIIGFENGKTAHIYATTNYTGHDTTTLHLETPNHTIEIRNADIYLDDEKLATQKIVNYMGKKCYGNSHATLIDSFYTALKEGSNTPIPPTSAQYAVRIILGAYRSNGKIIDI